VSDLDVLADEAKEHSKADRGIDVVVHDEDAIARLKISQGVTLL
jgi:hypothetical protein